MLQLPKIPAGYRPLLRTAALVVVVLALYALLLAVPRLSVWVVASFMMAMLLVTVIQTRALIQRNRYSLLRNAMRVVRSARRIFYISPSVQIFHGLAFSLGLITTALTFTGYREAVQIGSTATLVCFAVAGVVDLSRRTSQLIKFMWSDTIGKVLAVSIGAAMFGISVSMAKDWIHAAIRIDPKYVGDAVTISTALFLPLIYFALGIIILSVFALLQLIALVFLITLTMITGHLLGLVNLQNRDRARFSWFRIRHGMRPPGNKLPDRSLISLDDISLFVRPVSTLAVIGALGLLTEQARHLLPQLNPLFTEALVRLEYRSNSRCQGLLDDERVVYMDDGQISTARFRNREWKFLVQKCNLGTD